MSIKLNKQIAGQAALLTVLMVSVVTTSMAFFALERSTQNRRVSVMKSARSRALDALESAAQRLYRVYVQEAGCDPGILWGSSAMKVYTVDGASRWVHGMVIDYIAPNITAGSQGLSWPYNKPNTEYYLVNFGPVYTLERTDVDATTDYQDILHLENPTSIANFNLVTLGIDTTTARSPVSGPVPGFTPGGSFFYNPTNYTYPTPLGARDMQIELSVSYPIGRPTQVLRQSVVFQNICSHPYRMVAGGLYGGNFKSIDHAWLGGGMVPGRVCRANVPTVTLGSLDGDSLHTQINLEQMRNFLNKGLYEYGTNLSVDEALNCADINRDGIFTEIDVGLMEKLQSGYLFYIPPIYPEFVGGGDASHNLQ